MWDDSGGGMCGRRLEAERCARPVRVRVGGGGEGMTTREEETSRGLDEGVGSPWALLCSGMGVFKLLLFTDPLRAALQAISHELGRREKRDM